MKEIAFIIFNDAHLKSGNESEVIRSIRHLVKYAVENKVNNLVFAGDLFDSRTFQRQSVLQAFDEILRLFEENGLTLYIFPGNHDKTLYNSNDSFLDIYRHYPCVRFYRELTHIEINGIAVTLLPFYSDDLLVPMIEDSDGSDILISHFEMQGSTHLGHISEKENITRKMLRKWDKVYLGHYHNYHEITKDIVHLPSLRQSNFGEDNNKGFTLVYDDLSYELVKGDFREFNKIEININETSSAEIKNLISLHKDSENVVRFEFTGDESKLKAIDKSQFKDCGIDIKIKYSAKYTFDEKDLKMPENIEKYDEGQVRDNFKEFCEEKGYNYKKGETLLNEFFKRKNG